jgi:transcriptional regulator with XRE-family HTH domain
MAVEFIEINHAALRQILQTNGLAQSELARELNVTTKTIQRWLNGSVKKIKSDTFQQMERFLGTSGYQIRRHDQEISTGPLDPSLQILCDQYFYQRVRCNYDWHGYKQALKAYLKLDLPTAQRISAYKQIGASSMHMGEVQSARYYFDKALKLAEITEDIDEQIFILTWLGTHAVLKSNLQQGHVFFQKSERLLDQTTTPACKANYHFLYGSLLHYSEKYEDAVYHLRKSLRISLTARTPAEFVDAVKYFHLIGVYLRTRDYNLAAVAIHRNTKNAQRCSWIYGLAYNHFADLVVKVLQQQSPADLAEQIKAGRRLRNLSQYHHIDCRIDQLEYFLYLSSDRIEDAKNHLKKRFFKNRRSPLHFSRTVLDALFLQKLYPQQYTVRQSFIEKAEQQFARNNLQNSKRLLTALLGPAKFEKQELLAMFPF